MGTQIKTSNFNVNCDLGQNYYEFNEKIFIRCTFTREIDWWKNFEILTPPWKVIEVAIFFRRRQNCFPFFSTTDCQNWKILFALDSTSKYESNEYLNVFGTQFPMEYEARQFLRRRNLNNFSWRPQNFKILSPIDFSSYFTPIEKLKKKKNLFFCSTIVFLIFDRVRVSWQTQKHFFINQLTEMINLSTCSSVFESFFVSKDHGIECKFGSSQLILTLVN
jgi:hypothetical protein